MILKENKQQLLRLIKSMTEVTSTSMNKPGTLTLERDMEE